MLSSVINMTRKSDFVRTVKHIFNPISTEVNTEENGGGGGSKGSGDVLIRGSDSSGEQSMEGSPSRERLRSDVDSNSKLAKENRRMLVRIDERTAWIARLLVGTFMAILGAVYLSGGV